MKKVTMLTLLLTASAVLHTEQPQEGEVRKLKSTPGCVHLHEQYTNGKWTLVIRDRGKWVPADKPECNKELTKQNS